MVDRNINLDLDAGLKCFGEYSYRIVDPILFYTNVCGNVSSVYTRDSIDSQLRTELLTKLQPAFAKISAMGVRYSEVPAHTTEIAKELDELLTEEWKEHRGIEIETFGVSSVTLREEDEQIIKEAQRNAINRDPNMAAATLVGAQAQAMQDAANNEGGAGAFMGFAGMNMAQNAGAAQASGLFQQAGATSSGQRTDIDGTSAQMQANQASMGGAAAGAATGTAGSASPGSTAGTTAGVGEWVCECQEVNKGNFCGNCGKPRPVARGVWTCDCGQENTGNFCGNCGKPRP